MSYSPVQSSVTQVTLTTKAKPPTTPEKIKPKKDIIKKTTTKKKQQTGPAPALRKGIKITSYKGIWAQEPDTILKPSDNYSNRPNGISIDTIVLHCSVSKTSSSIVATFRIKKGNSAHIIIPDKGFSGNESSSIRMVSDKHQAYHTNSGAYFDGKPNLDSRALGIEIVNMGTLEDPYSEWQIKETIQWCRYWTKKYKIKYIITHAYLQPNRRDPCATFPWKEFVTKVLKEVPNGKRNIQ